MKFRKKPVVVEAVQWTGENIEEITKLGDYRRVRPGNEKGNLIIETLEGNHVAKKFDWIIKGIQGEVYPCKPEIFEQTYEEVKE